MGGPSCIIFSQYRETFHFIIILQHELIDLKGIEKLLYAWRIELTPVSKLHDDLQAIKTFSNLWQDYSHTQKGSLRIETGDPPPFLWSFWKHLIINFPILLPNFWIKQNGIQFPKVLYIPLFNGNLCVTFYVVKSFPRVNCSPFPTPASALLWPETF